VNPVLEFWRNAARRHWLGAMICAALTVACAILASEGVPELYPVDAQVLMVEPVVVHRLANPFAPVPSSPRELQQVPELLRSRERLVAIVKRTGLLDQWDAGRPWPLRLKDRVLELIVGPMTEEDRIDALVGMLDKRLIVTVEGNKVLINAQWTTRELALALVQNTLGTLLQLRAQREGKTLQEAAEALDVQYTSVVQEMTERARRMEKTLGQPGGWASIEGDREQLLRDQARAAELLVSSEEKHIAAEVFRQSNNLRFLVVRPPVLPREPLGARPFERSLVLAIAALLAGLVSIGTLGIMSGRLLSAQQVQEHAGLPTLTSLALRPGKWWVRPTTRGVLLTLALAAATGMTVGLTHAKWAASLLPPVFFLGAWVIWTRPLKWPFLLMVLLAVTVDDPTDRAYSTLWQSPLWPLGKTFFTNIALFTGFELFIIGLTGLMLLRRIVMPRELLAKVDPLPGQAPRPMVLALGLSLLTIGFLIAMGLARGGVFREALWQFRALLMMPFAALLALYALELPKDLPKLFAVLVGGSLVKALLGIFFMYAIAFPRAAYPPHTTGHNDTMIFVTAVVTALTLFWEKPIRRHLWIMVLWLPLIALALRLNDRRIAYVDIVIALGLIAYLSPMHEMKLKLKRVLVALSPVLILYLAVGWTQTNSKVFGPAQKVRSIIAPAKDTEEESSNVERDIENYNLMKSWERDMLFGQGFGHAFTEFVLSNDFKQSNFGHVGHNSILWLLWIGGIFGFTAVLLYLAVTLYFFGRTLPVTAPWRERVALYISLSIIVTYLMQAFGDMGTQSVMFDFFVGIALAITGRLATRAGVWVHSPARQAFT
jgi:hypothetical protein